MREQPVEILLVEDDADLAVMMERCLHETVSANVTLVSSASDAMREELTTRYGIMVIESDLPDGRGLDLIGEIRATNRAPIVLLADSPSVAEVIEALRTGVRDVLPKPLDLARLAEVVQQAAESIRIRDRRRTRNRRLRLLTSKIIRERRDLRQRIDLICQDFVHAYRRLAQRVADAEMISPRK